MAHSPRCFVSWYVKRLFLLRHAKSAWDDPALRDRDRPLAPKGRKAAKRVARWAKKHGVRPQLVVCSSAVRAQQTLQRLLPGLGEPEVWVEVTLYAAGVETLLARIRPFPTRPTRRCSSGTIPA